MTHTQNKGGRPRKPDQKKVTYSLPAQIVDKLREQAQARNITRSELVAQVIKALE